MLVAGRQAYVCSTERIDEGWFKNVAFGRLILLMVIQYAQMR